MSSWQKEEIFIEQAEYLSEQELISWNADHPQEDYILNKLSGAGAKLISGPRGSGKTTLMKKSLYKVLRDKSSAYFSTYVNFKLSIKIEPIYSLKPFASAHFKKWMVAKIYLGILESLKILEFSYDENIDLTEEKILSFMLGLESGLELDSKKVFTVEYLKRFIDIILEKTNKTSFIILIDDAAHAFSPKQQSDFFDFFREIKSRNIAPKASIYPGITTSSANFHVGHDAEQIDVWVNPVEPEYIPFMRELFKKRFPDFDMKNEDILNNIDFLSFSSFGIPRSFLNMIRSLDAADGIDLKNKRKVLKVSKSAREASHDIYNSLEKKMPSYRNIISSGGIIYNNMIGKLKEYNKGKNYDMQGLEVGISNPIPAEVVKVIDLFQYSGLLMPLPTVLRGEKGKFNIYLIHFSDLVVDNCIVGKRTKVISDFLRVFNAYSTGAQRWPRINIDTLLKHDDTELDFSFSLPNCSVCNAPRINQEARYCHNCGSELKSPSVYDELVNQDISCLPISSAKVAKIKSHSNIRTVKDIFLDNSREQLRKVPTIGKVWAKRIIGYAEEHVA